MSGSRGSRYRPQSYAIEMVIAMKMARPTRCVHMLHVSLCRWNTCGGGEEGRGGEGLGGVNALKLYRHREKRICRLMLRATVDGKISTAVWSTGGRCSIKFILEGHVAW